MPEGKRRSILDTLLDRVREVLETLGQLGPLLRPGKINPAPLPVRQRRR